MDSLSAFIPGLYLESDADGSMSAFIGTFDEVHDKLIMDIETLPTANQPRYAPLSFMEYVATHYGNPFPFMTAERWQEGAKSENLLYLYTLRGTKQGIISAVRYLCGVNVSLLQDFEFCWELNVSQLGATPSVGAPGFGTAFGVNFGS